MGHTFPVEDAERLEDAESRYSHLSGEEVIGLVRPSSATKVLDVGSGTGFYTDVIAPYAKEVCAVDLQEKMHRLYEKKGTPSKVKTVTCDASEMPFGDGTFERALSTMTYHELPAAAVTEMARVVRPGGRLVVADWTSAGSGDAGPPLSERFDAWTAGKALDEAGFSVRRAESRGETLLVVATR